jgi:hypothetical protein
MHRPVHVDKRNGGALFSDCCITFSSLLLRFYLCPLPESWRRNRFLYWRLADPTGGLRVLLSLTMCKTSLLGVQTAALPLPLCAMHHHRTNMSGGTTVPPLAAAGSE